MNWMPNTISIRSVIHSLKDLERSVTVIQQDGMFLKTNKTKHYKMYQIH